MKVMVRLTDGWDYWDVVVKVAHDPYEEGDTFDWAEAVYEAARYLPRELIIPYDKMEEYLSSIGEGPFNSFSELLDAAFCQEWVVHVDYLKGFIQVWPADSRVVPPNSKLGPVSNELPARERYKPFR